jgi:hypothetical protein
MDNPGAAGSSLPQTSCDGTQVFVLWGDDRNGSVDIFFNLNPQ